MATDTETGTSWPNTAAATRTAHNESGLFVCLLLIIVCVAAPGKFLFYAAPFLILGLTALSVPLISASRFLTWVAAFGAFGSISVIIDAIDGQHVSWWGIVFGLYTYSMIIMAFSSAGGPGVSERTYIRLAYACSTFMIFQSLIGFGEFVVTHNGDYVSGTLGLTDSIGGGHTISQVNFTFNIFMMIVFCLPLIRRLYIILGILLGLLVCAVAQSAHQTIFFIVTPMVLGLLNTKYAKYFIFLSIPIFFILIQVFIFYPDTPNNAIGWFNKILLNEHSLKRRIVLDSIDYLGSVKNFIFGLGLGQFTSRAALFIAGDSSSTPLPDFVTDMSKYYRDSLKPLLRDYAHTGEGSAISKPYFTALSILVEFGPLFSLAVLILIIKELRRNSKVPIISDKIVDGASYYCNFFLVFLMMCSLIENYAEFTQAISIPVVLYLVAKARISKARLDIAT
jgi:hypothetical protein